MESRKGNSNKVGRLGKSAELPVDYLELVTEIFMTNFGDGLKAYRKYAPTAKFYATGAVYPNEIVMAVSLLQEGALAATTVMASVDFDPKASAPTAQDLLAASVDAIGAQYEELLDPENQEMLENVASESLSALEKVPFEWTQIKLDRYKIFLKVDKSNPELERQADDWLAKNDPDASHIERENEEQTAKLFVTGEKAKKAEMSSESSDEESDDDDDDGEGDDEGGVPSSRLKH